jgi:hypothetical protein
MIEPMKTPAETQHYLTYVLNGITYVPHYNKDCYVSPGYAEHATGMVDSQGNKFYAPDTNKEYSAHELEKAGATKTAMLLWTRSKFKALR